ncbi:hypothetical protein HDV03_003489 [Kappamyces sp. JEL0829]|nr:hypothetical protein HDV03_003489 [Kappamyces sp. JEL0829]
MDRNEDASTLSQSLLSTAVNLKRDAFAIVFYVTNSDYVCSALINVKRLRRFQTAASVDIIFMAPETNAIPAVFFDKITALGIKVLVTEPIRAANDINPYYRDCMNKLYIFKLEQYQRVIFLDSDSLVLRNMDALFLLPSASPQSRLAAPRAGWIDQTDRPWFTSWFLVVEPSAKVYQERIYGRLQSLRADTADMDLLNQEFGKDVFMLPYYFGILDSWWVERKEGPARDEQRWLEENAYAVHFSDGKPFLKSRQMVWDTKNQTVDPFYMHLWESWYRGREEVC